MAQTPTQTPRFAGKVPASSVVSSAQSITTTPTKVTQPSTSQSLPKIALVGPKPTGNTPTPPPRPTVVFSAPKSPANPPAAPAVRFPTPSQSHNRNSTSSPHLQHRSYPQAQSIAGKSPAPTSSGSPAPRGGYSAPQGPQIGSKLKVEEYDGGDSDVHVQSISSARLPPPRAKSARSSARRSYEQYANDGEDDDDQDMMDVDEDDGADDEEIDRVSGPSSLIDRILGHRKLPSIAAGFEDSFEYLIKWRGKSFLHTSWVTAEYLRSLGVGGKSRLLKYWKFRPVLPGLEPDEDDASPAAGEASSALFQYFPPEYVEVERIIAEKEEFELYEEPQDEQTLDIELVSAPPTTRKVKKYLVKWAGLPYSDASWESDSDINDDEAIEKFKKRNAFPGPVTYPPHPAATSFKRMPKSPLFKDGNELRAYQLEGLNWLAFNWYHRRGCILADEMGLGKTVQSITFLDFLYRNERVPGPFLAIVPLSTIGHWQREIESWTDMNVIVYSGNKETRQVIREYEWLYSGTQQIKFHILLTTYEMLMAEDWTELTRVHWKCCVIDEAQRLKNSNSKLAQNLRHFRTSHRILLTGTPIQNNTTELWSLLNFIAPETFSSRELFVRRFGNLQSKDQVDDLHRILKPFLLRRLKGDVEKSIPPKEETIVEVELSKLQKQYYRAILDRNRSFLNKGLSNKNTPNLINVMMQLRKVCNHPYLIKGCEENDLAGVPPAEHLQKTVSASTKLVFLDKLLPKLREGGHKVLIFSQMVRVLDILAHYLALRGHKFERLDGGVRGNDRQAAIDRFCKPDSDIFVFLLCTRAGGVGINLAAADTVIIFDSDWNPQNDIQAQARAHRIGQTSEVKVYRLLTAKTYERGMFERASRKLGLDQAVLSNLGVSSDPTKALDDKEIDILLKYGAYELFRADNDKEPEDLDLDKVLERSQKFVWNNPEASAGNSSFSTAHFQGDKDESGIDLTAPNFWEKVLPDNKSFKSLEKALENSAATLVQDPSERAKFITTLESRVTDFLREWQEGQGDHEEAEQLIRIIGITRQQHLDRPEGLFTAEEYQKLGSWMEEVSHPRRKRRVAASNAAAVFTAVGAAMNTNDGFQSSGNEAFTGTGETEEEDTTYGRRASDSTAQAAAAAARNQWSRAERIAFHEAFMACPDSRWDHMQSLGSNGALQNKTLEEIYQYARKFLQTCIQQCEEASEKEDKNVFQDALDGLIPPSRESVDLEIARNGGVDRTSITKPSMSADATYKRLIPKKLKTWARRLRHLATLKNVVLTAAAYFGPPVDLANMRVPQTAQEIYDFTMQKIQNVPLMFPTKPLAKWWTRQEDRTLLFGTFKHGYGRYQAMLQDPELSFCQYLPRIHAANASSLAVATAQQKQKLDGRQDDAASTPLDLFDERQPKTEDAQQAPLLESTAIQKPVLPEELFKVISLSFEPVDPASADESSQLKMRVKLLHSRSHLGDQFPDSRTLDSHVKWLLDQIRNSFRAGERDASRRKNRTVAAPAKDEPKKQKIIEQKKADKGKIWSKKEEKELRSAIMMFGGGYWEVLRIQAGLDTKTEDQVREYFFNLMGLCRQISHQAQGRSAVEAEGDEHVEDAVSTKREPTPLDSVMAWPIDPNDLLSGGNMMIPGPNHPVLAVTPTMARRHLRRVALFQDIRTKVLLHEQLHERLADARFSDVPPWWVPVVTDVALLESVIKYGIGGPQQWEEFLKDPECPLFAIEADGRRTVVPIETQELKRAFFHDFLIDKSPLVSRLEMLVQTVLRKPIAAPPPAFHPPHYVKEEYPSSSTSSSIAAAAAAAAATAASSSGRVSTRANGKRKHYDGEYGAPDAKRSKHSAEEEAPSGKMTARSVPRDDDGTVILPITAKGATIVSLGYVVHDRPKYHARSYIWPVGFKSTRKMPSIKNPQQQVIYTSEIVDNGDAPGFRVTPADAPELSMTFNTASRVWMEMLRKIKRRQSISVSGPETYGYSDPTVRMLIQELDGAEHCESYQWVNFDGSWTKEDKLARATGQPYSAPQHPSSSSRRASTPGRKRPRGQEPAHSSFETDEVEDDSEDRHDVDIVSPEPPRPTGKYPLTTGPARSLPQKQPKSSMRGPHQEKPPVPTGRTDAEQQLRDLNDRLAKIQQRQQLLKSAQASGSPQGVASPPMIRRVKPMQPLPAPTHGLNLHDDDHGLSPIESMEFDGLQKAHHHEIAVSVTSDGSMTPIDHLGDIDPLPSDLGEEEMQMIIENME